MQRGHCYPERCLGQGRRGVRGAPWRCVTSRAGCALGLGLAGVSCLGLHHLARQSLLGAGQLGSLLLPALAHRLALADQCLLRLWFGCMPPMATWTWYCMAAPASGSEAMAAMYRATAGARARRTDASAKKFYLL